jgi:hypothetical protein
MNSKHAANSLPVRLKFKRYHGGSSGIDEISWVLQPQVNSLEGRIGVRFKVVFRATV